MRAGRVTGIVTTLLHPRATFATRTLSSCAPATDHGRRGAQALMPPLTQSHIPGIPCRRGKVRDIYDLGDRLVIVATDRMSAFDYVLPSGIPDKGRVLTALTLFWLDQLRVPNHFLSADLEAMGP